MEENDLREALWILEGKYSHEVFCPFIVWLKKNKHNDNESVWENSSTVSTEILGNVFSVLVLS